jgi:membrane fusion protein (multidrug efflux system)
VAVDTDTRARRDTEAEQQREDRREPASDAGQEQRRRAPEDQRDKGERENRDDQKQGGGTRRWPLIVLAIVVVLAIIGGVGYWYLTRNEQTTVDAYTEGNAVSFASKVTGYVTALDVNDNTYVNPNYG